MNAIADTDDAGAGMAAAWPVAEDGADCPPPAEAPDGAGDRLFRRARVAAADELRLREWIAAVVRRDQAALAALYEAMVGRVYGLALRITREVQTAEEVAEDTFWQIWRQAPRFEAARGTALAWIMTIARSRALDALRRADPAECREDAAELADSADGADAPAGGSPARGDPQDLLCAVQQGHRLHAALARLEPLPRQLVALAFFRGLSHEEIAGQTGLPLGTVKSHIRRALIRLRDLLDPGPDTPMVVL